MTGALYHLLDTFYDIRDIIALLSSDRISISLASKVINIRAEDFPPVMW